MFMRIVLEAQHICVKEPRGIPIYTAQIIRALLKRQKFEYAITFFDKNKERGNRIYIDNNFSGLNADIYECNSESYGTLWKKDCTVYNEKSYNELTGAYGDIFHFTHIVPIPSNLRGEMIVTVHDILPLTHPEFFSDSLNEDFKFHWEKLLKIQPTIIADSEATKNEIFQLSGYKNVNVVKLGYDDNVYYADPNYDVLKSINLNTPYIFYCGGIDMRKNIIGILDAFDDVIKDIPNLKLVFAGNFYTNAEPIIKRMKKYENDDRVVLLGYISNDMKRILMSNASAFLFPSFYEGFGLPILEAMACGCPVITSNQSSLPEVAGDAAIKINPYDISSFANSIKTIVSSPQLQEEFRGKGLAHVKKYTWDKVAEEVENVYKSVYSKKNKSM